MPTIPGISRAPSAPGANGPPQPAGDGGPEPQRVVLHLPVGIRSFSLAVLAVFACFFVLRWAQAVFVPIVLAMIVSYALSPIVSRLHRWRIPRPLSAAVLLCALVAGTGSMLYSLSDDAAAVVESLPEAAQRLRRTLRSPEQVPVTTIDNVQKAAAELERAAAENAAPATPNAPGVTRVVIEPPRFNIKDYLWTGTLGLAAVVGETAIVLLLTFFLLASGDSFRRKMVKLAGPKLSQKRITVDALDEINVQIQRYLLVQLFTSAIVGVATGLAFAAMGLQHPLVWGIAAGITNLIPYLGAAALGGASMLVAFMQFGTIERALLIGAASLLIHAIVANVILPWMTSRTARMSPVTVFVAVLAWGWLWGIWGLLLGVPILMVVKAVCDRVDDLKPIGEFLGDLTVRGLWALVLAVTAATAADGPKLPVPTSEERHEYMRRAHVWEPTDVGAADLYNGAKSKNQFAVGEEITCDFFPKPIAGLTEKFLCKLEDGRIFKVKYNASERFKEAYSEAMGTRLFHALGFYSDKVFPVRVTCRGCPRRPWDYVREKKAKRFLDAEGMITNLPPEAEVGTHTFDPAAVEEQRDVQTIERKKDEGWSWKSLKRVDPTAGGSPRAETDALKLLCAFVQNSDNKAKQNRLACPTEEIVEEGGHVSCRHPIMYVDDLGSVFGKGGFITGYDGRMDFAGWKELRVWKSEKSCRARLKGIGGIFRPSNLRNPKISEEGRVLLAHQLEQLSDDQIADLFKAGRIEGLHQTIDDKDESREVTVDDWVAVFKQKRDQITGHTGCQP